MNEKYKLQEKKSINEVQKTELTNSDENIIPPRIMNYLQNLKERNYGAIQNEIEKQKNQIAQMDKIEAKRIIYEYDFRNYERGYNMDCSIALTAIIGAKNVQTESIRNAMKKK